MVERWVGLPDGLVARTGPAAGEAVFWVHGYTLDSSVWGDLWGRLPRWTHVGIDLPGHGASRPMRPDESLPALARSLGRWAGEYGARHLVGLSFGSMIAMQMALEFPDAFATLTVAAPALAGGPEDPRVERLYEELYELGYLGRSAAELAARWVSPATPLFAGARRCPVLWPHVVELTQRHSWSELTTGAMRHFTSYAQRPRALRGARARVLVLVGEQEISAFRRCGELVRRSVPGCHRVYLPDAGHLCLLEAPDRAAELIDRHLLGDVRRSPS